MDKATAWIAAHRKTIAALAGVAVTIAVHIWGPSNYWVQVAVLAATVLGVYQVPNAHPAPVPAAAETTKAAPRA